ncbi:MAG: anti-sigma factor [bacterium]|nr:anti-sigma factor [bacterium]
MTERDNDRDESQERLILELLDSRVPDELLGGELGSEFHREYVEVLGLLPRALPEVPPSAEVKDRILAAVEREAAADRERAASPRATTSIPARTAGSVASRPNWLLPLAASIAVAMMAVTGWLVIQVRDQQFQIAELSNELERAQSVTAALATSQGMLAEVRSRLALVTAPGAEFCALSPPEGSPATAARGMVVMHPVKDEWFLRIEGLGPCPRGRKYTVWFVTESGETPGPVFAVKANEAIELTVSGRPEGIEAIMITLEDDPVPEAPSMAPLLFGDERMQLL